MLTGGGIRSKDKTLQQPAEMIRVLDGDHSAGARMVLGVQPQQPEPQRRGTPHGRPGFMFSRLQRAYRAVAREQGPQTFRVVCPVVGDNRQIEQQTVLAGEIEIKDTGNRFALPQHVVAKEVTMDDATRQVRIVDGRLKIELGEQSTALVGCQQRRQRPTGRLTPRLAAWVCLLYTSRCV